MSACYTCDLIQQRDAGAAPLWDCIYRAQFWDLVHSYNTALPGWLVLVSRRHIAAIDEMTDDEAVELGRLLHRVSVALKGVTKCTKSYVVQFAEASNHRHVHFHVIPRMDDQPEEYKGPNIFKYLGVPLENRVSEADMNQIAAEIQRTLLEM